MFKKKEFTPPVNLPYKPHEFPSIRIGTAVANRADKELCFVVGGGIGDRVCAEPTLRFALDHFKDCGISLICETPELFAHLKFKEVFDLKKTHPVIGHHLYLYTYPATPLANQFLNANLTHCLDYPSLSALRMMLPPDYRSVRLSPPTPSHREDILEITEDRSGHYVLIHPGKTWPTRTFPESWWNGVIKQTLKQGFTPVLIGSQTVDVICREPVIDLRGTTSLTELAYLCMNSRAIITNDSSPLHLAAAGEAWIAYVGTCHRGDLLLHSRVFGSPSAGPGWKMRDFGVGEMWNMFPLAPNLLSNVNIDQLPEGRKIEDFLPRPADILDWIDRIITL